MWRNTANLERLRWLLDQTAKSSISTCHLGGEGRSWHSSACRWRQVAAGKTQKTIHKISNFYCAHSPNVYLNRPSVEFKWIQNVSPSALCGSTSKRKLSHRKWLLCSLYGGSNSKTEWPRGRVTRPRCWKETRAVGRRKKTYTQQLLFPLETSQCWSTQTANIEKPPSLSKERRRWLNSKQAKPLAPPFFVKGVRTTRGCITHIRLAVPLVPGFRRSNDSAAHLLGRQTKPRHEMKPKKRRVWQTEAAEKSVYSYRGAGHVQVWTKVGHLGSDSREQRAESLLPAAAQVAKSQPAGAKRVCASLKWNVGQLWATDWALTALLHYSFFFYFQMLNSFILINFFKKTFFKTCFVGISKVRILSMAAKLAWHGRSKQMEIIVFLWLQQNSDFIGSTESLLFSRFFIFSRNAKKNSF